MNNNYTYRKFFFYGFYHANKSNFISYSQKSKIMSFFPIKFKFIDKPNIFNNLINDCKLLIK